MKIILTPQKWVSAILLFVFIAMYHNAKAQTGVTITVNGSVSGHTTTCTDGFATGSPDPEFEVRYDNVVTTNYGGDGDDGESTNCNNTGACSAPLVDGCGTVCGGGSLELYCPGATFDVKFRGFEDDLIDECVQAWITRTVTVNSTAAGAASVTAPTFSTPYANNGSTLTGIAYTVNTSGTFAPNNRDVTNKTCATAWTSTTKSSANPLLNNGTGAVVSGHSTDCGDAWYLYVLTDNNLSRLTFDATGDGNEAEVFYNCCGGTPLPDDVNLSGAYEIANPKPGNYYVRINTASLSSLPYIFTLNVSKTTGGARPANDDICNAIAIGGATLDYCEAPAGVAGTNVNSTNQDGCGVFEPQEDDGRTVWYKFTTNATQVGAQLRVKVEHTGGDAMAPDLSLFKLTGAAFTCATANPFSSLTLIAEDDGTSVVDRDAEFVISACSSLYEANKTYYLQIDDEGGLDGNGTFTVTIEDVGASVGPDNICSAYDLGTYAGTEPFCGPKTVRTDGGSEAGKLEINEQFRINSETNVCAGPQGSEPNSPNKTTWYKFTTGATVGTSVTVLVDAIDKSNAFGDLDAFVSVHSNCSACTFGDLTEVADCGLCFSSGPDDASVSFTPKPNTTYYIQVDGYNPVLGVGGGPIGVYDVQVTMNNTPRVANDDICNAVTLTVPTATCGTNPTTSANVSGTTVGASSQDKCTVNEPGADLTDQTVWYKFTMGADVPREIIVNVDQTSCNDIGVLNIIGPTIYELNGATFTCVTANPFSSLGSPAIADAPNGVDYSQARLECPIPGKTYYVQVQGRTIDECEQGTFTINLEIPDVLLGPDKICNAFDLGILSNTTNVDLVKTCQTNSCATIVGTEPDNTGLSDLDKTVWYRFTTPPAYYADGSLAHLYNIQVDRRGSSPSTTVPDIYLYKESAATVRTCTPENAASFANLQFVGTDAGNAVPLLETGAEIEYLCLEAATTYYIQVDHLGLGSYVDFDVRVKKSAFRPGNDLCSATDLAYIIW
jgi:hypothetical protein